MHDYPHFGATHKSNVSPLDLKSAYLSLSHPRESMNYGQRTSFGVTVCLNSLIQPRYNVVFKYLTYTITAIDRQFVFP
jgi:hypothetical protein